MDGHRPAALFVDIMQPFQKLLIFRFFTDDINAGGDDPDRHSTPGAGHQQIDNHLVVRGFLPGKGEKADQQPGIQKIPFVVGKTQAFRQRPFTEGALQRIPAKPLGSLMQDVIHNFTADEVPAGFGEQAGAQIIQCGQVVKQYAARAVRPLDLDADLRADDLCQFPVLLCFTI